jgi:hypothetical protein
MKNLNLRKLGIWELKANSALWLVNGVVSGIFLVILGDFHSFPKFFLSKLTLFETGAALIVGGVVAFSGSLFASKIRETISKNEEQWSLENLRSNEKKANQYLLLGLIVFVEAVVISFFGF